MPQLGLIQYVVMDQGSDVDKFNNDGQSDVFVPNTAGRAACQQSEAWAKAFSRAPHDILDVIAQTWVKTAHLAGQGHFYPRQLGRNRFQ